MRFTVTTWNINSVRLRIAQVRRFLDDVRPDVLCLQETKCPEDQFPLKDLQACGYGHVVHCGQKGYNGVAILARHSFSVEAGFDFCERGDARHVAIALGPDAGAAAGIAIHNFYVPAGGEVPDPDENPKFAHKLSFLGKMRRWGGEDGPAKAPAILVGDLNVAPLEHDVWSHKALLNVVSHTPVETEALEAVRGEAGWVDAARHLAPEPEKIFTWWSYRGLDGWEAANRGRRLDHVWISPDLAGTLKTVHVARATRSWTRPSDHVPVTAVMEL
jgi:exodeoxyribonuclease-3